jgi:hypothetical protein
MNKHLYLRAYLAGIAAPTVFLLVVMTGYTILRYVVDFPVPIERIIVFPMAVVPNVWGLWNVAFVALREKLHLPIGLHGMLLPFLLAPFAIVVISLLDIPRNLILHALPVGIPIALIIYYLAWKYLVNGLNAVLGIA